MLGADSTAERESREALGAWVVRRRRAGPVGPIGRMAPAFLLAPAMSLLALFVLVPTVLAVACSFFSVPLTDSGSWRWVGLGNYRTLFADPAVVRALVNTVLYCGMTIVPSMAIGLGLALAVERAGRGGALLRTALFLPMTANLVAMAVVFRWIFALSGGVANQLLGYAGIAPLNWLGDTRYSLLSVALVGVWRSASFCMIVFLAGLATVPGVVHESARADGVRGLAKLRRVTLPMIRPTLVFVTVISVVMSVQVFDTVNVMTAGGPQESSETVLTMVWQLGFVYFDLGRAAALSSLLLIVLIAISLLRRRAFAGQA